MNKKFFSVSISIAFHLLLIWMAINLVIFKFMHSASGQLPLYVHVRVDGNLSANSKLNQAHKVPSQQTTATQHLSAPQNDLNTQQIPLQHATQPRVQVMPSLVQQPFIAIVKEHGALEDSMSTPPKRMVVSPLVSSQEVLNDLVPSSNVEPNTAPMVTAASSMENPAGLSQNFIPKILSGSPDSTMRLPLESMAHARDVKSFLGYDLYTYEDPQDHGRYFKLSIHVAQSVESLPVLPKEIIFLVDSSNSIGEKVLSQFKQGVERCFKLLGRQDKFNIIIFKNNTVTMSQHEALPNTPDSVYTAGLFLESTLADSETDVYEAVLQSIRLKNALKPAYVFLISDGQPTVGVVNPQQIINQIVQTNRGVVPIFAFGAGIFLERYLMSFLSFTNRGWAAFAPNDIADGIVDFYKQIQNPVLINPHYYASGLETKEIYPKLLPDIFKGSAFVLYGRYTDERSFFLQLYAEGKDGLKRYLIADDLSQAPHGPKQIAQEWAVRKVYDLIGQMEYNKNNKGLIHEIKSLQKKFHLNLSSFVLEKIKT